MWLIAALSWLRCRVAARALIPPLARELPYATGVAIKIYIYFKKLYLFIYCLF